MSQRLPRVDVSSTLALLEIEPRKIKPYTESIEDRFWPYVDKDGPVPVHAPELGPCWLWTGSKNNHGYGQIRIEYQCLMAHRVAWVLTNLKPIPSKLHLLHACDNPACVNPEHTCPGTRFDNMQDAASKGRTHGQRAFGQTCPNGHPRTPESTRAPGLLPRCLLCYREQTRRACVKWRKNNASN